MSLYKKIISSDNIKNAYLDLQKKLILKCKTQKYSGIDGAYISGTEPISKQILIQSKKELINQTQLKPAKCLSIPKIDGSTREIYLTSISDRIKCQAIFRILEKHLEKNVFSKYLYSYRNKKPSYYAIRSARRFYLKNHNKNYHVLKLDFKKYTDNLDHKVLKNRLIKYGIDEKTIQLVNLFIEMPYYNNGDLMCFNKGVMQGMPLCVLFGNLYMAHIDDYIGNKVEFYRRVGDDIIMFDKSKRNLQEIEKYLQTECKKAKIQLNNEKTILQPITESFIYLGLKFNNGLISIPDSSYKKITTSFKKRFSPKSQKTLKEKKNHIKYTLNIKKNGHSEVLKVYSDTYNLITDWSQIKKLSKHINRILSAYLSGGYSLGRFSRVRTNLRNIKYQTFFHSFKQLQKK